MNNYITVKQAAKNGIFRKHRQEMVQRRQNLFLKKSRTRKTVCAMENSC